MYDYSYSYDVANADAGLLAGVMAFMATYMLVVLAVAVFMIICMWKIFTKAGKPGWAALIPIYNVIVLLEIVGRPAWWVLFLFASAIPFVGWIAALAFGIIIALDLAKSFGKDVGFGILLLLLPIVGYPMLAFGKAEYAGPVAAKAAEK